jgi:thioredoxin 1
MMKKFSAVLFSLGGLLASSALAFSPVDFNEEKFLAAQEAGKIILVEVGASWCPTCRGQKTDLKKIFKDKKFKDVVAFQVDFDDKSLVERVGKLIGRPIPRQSTIAVLKGKKLVELSVAKRGDALKADIEKAFKS